MLVTVAPLPHTVVPSPVLLLIAWWSGNAVAGDIVSLSWETRCKGLWDVDTRGRCGSEAALDV